MKTKYNYVIQGVDFKKVHMIKYYYEVETCIKMTSLSKYT